MKRHDPAATGESCAGSMLLRWMPRSLRGRLLVALLVVLLSFWAVWFGCQSMMLNRQQTGWWDSSLRLIAQQILLSLPDNVDQVTNASRTFRLPPGERSAANTPPRRLSLAERAFRGEKASFQVWTRSGQSAFRSPGAPTVPLRADFQDGFADAEVDGHSWRVYSIGDSSGRIVVQVGRTHEQLHAELARWIKLSLVAALLVGGLLAAVLWFVICWSLRPVTKVQDAIQQRHALDLKPLPSVDLPEEVAPLVESFNRLMQRLDTSVQGERRFIADAAHELRTPLAALLAHTQLALDAKDPQEGRDALIRLNAVVQRSARLAEQLLDLARLDQGRTLDSERRIGLYEVIEVVVRDFELSAQQKQQRIALELEVCEIVGDIDSLGILVRNLVDNALRYSGVGGRVQVSCGSQDGEVMLKVADDGPGVPESEYERIFDRFYRVPGAGGRGSGVGLSLVSRIAQLHGARIEVGRGLGGRGFGVVLRFAAPPPAGAAASARHAGVEAAGGAVAAPRPPGVLSPRPVDDPA
jgi:two-component system sensor histidine kinase QseC